MKKKDEMMKRYVFLSLLLTSPFIDRKVNLESNEMKICQLLGRKL